VASWRLVTKQCARPATLVRECPPSPARTEALKEGWLPSGSTPCGIRDLAARQRRVAATYPGG